MESTRKFRKMKNTRVFETIRRPEIVLFMATNASIQDPIQLRYRLTGQIVKRRAYIGSLRYHNERKNTG